MKSTKITNTAETAQRADVLLAATFPAYSRAALAKLFAKGTITQAGKTLKPGEKLQPGEVFEAVIETLEKPAESIDLPVIYEDTNIIVIDKPVGVISHARGRYWDEASVASFVRDRMTAQRSHADAMQGDTEHRTEQYKKEYGKGEAEVATQQGAVSSGRVASSASKQADTMWSSGSERAGIVHRLDRATSGVMICAKNAETLSMLQKQFSQRKTKKSYFAVVEGQPELDTAVIEVPLGRNPNKPQTFKPDPQGKESSSTYKIIKTNGDFSLLELTPKTGRTHQLRVHLQYIKHPIVGDELYGGHKAERLFLHAYSLEITVPGGERKTFISKVPSEFNKLIA